VLNQYQRRADLVPNLVNTVKGFAQQEKDVLLGVTTPLQSGQHPGHAGLVNDPAAFSKSLRLKANDIGPVSTARGCRKLSTT